MLPYWELSNSDVVGKITKALGKYSCEARDEKHKGELYVVRTNQGPYVLCRGCCKKLGLSVRA